MAVRPDTIFHDVQADRFGGSNYNHFSLVIAEPNDAANALGTGYEVAWIAPRGVRIVNARLLSTDIAAEGDADSTLDVIRNATDAGTNRAVITQIDPDATTGDLTVDTVYTPTLSTDSADGYPHVVADQYDFFAMLIGFGANADGPFTYSFIGHVSFEDL